MTYSGDAHFEKGHLAPFRLSLLYMQSWLDALRNVHTQSQTRTHRGICKIHT